MSIRFRPYSCDVLAIWSRILSIRFLWSICSTFDFSRSALFHAIVIRGFGGKDQENLAASVPVRAVFSSVRVPLRGWWVGAFSVGRFLSLVSQLWLYFLLCQVSALQGEIGRLILRRLSTRKRREINQREKEIIFGRILQLTVRSFDISASVFAVFLTSLHYYVSSALSQLSSRLLGLLISFFASSFRQMAACCWIFPL